MNEGLDGIPEHPIVSTLSFIFWQRLRDVMTQFDQRSLRVLYMDDDLVVSKRIQSRLEQLGLTVDLATNGESGLVMHRVKQYDVLLISQEMPVRTGLDVVWTLSAKNELPPAVMLADEGDAEVAVQAMKLGVGDYLVKDAFDRYIDLLPGTIATVVERRRSELEKDRMLAAFQASKSRLEESNLALIRLAAMDGLTGIANRRLFNEVLEKAWANSLQTGAPISLILTDVDNFKPYNDIYGHLAGDDCLKQVARVVGRVPERHGEQAARYGGEEFAVILPNRTEAEAARMATAMRRNVEALRIAHRASDHNGVVTISVGVVTRVATEDADPSTLIEGADACLYRAKESGRNWVITTNVTPKSTRSVSMSGSHYAQGVTR